jgi:hypothetical protein
VATQTRNPTSDEATSGTLSGSAGTRYTLVDDHPDSAGTDALSFGTATAQITFGFSVFSIPAGSTSISVQVLYYDGEAANGANNCGGRLKVGTNYFNAATHNPSGTTYTSRNDNWATNPDTTAAWTVDQINGVGSNALAAFGIGSTDSNPAFRVSSVQLQVTYTAPSSSGDAATSATAQTSAAAGSVTTSGTAATSASAQTSALSGASTVAGALASVASGQVTAADGTVEDLGGDITGTAATQASAQTSAASGATAISGALATSASVQVSAASGTATIAGVTATASSAQTSSLSGASTITGAAATAAAAQVTSASGATGEDSEITGTAETSTSAQSSSASGTVAISGVLATATGGQSSALVGDVTAVPTPRPRKHARSFSTMQRARSFAGVRRLRRMR